MEKAIYFDMDGTIADFFAVPTWLADIRAEKTFPYEVCTPLFNAEKMANTISTLKAQGYTIGIISYTATNATREYARAIRKAKIEWLKKYFPYADEIHIIGQKTPKWKVAKIKNAILVDDDAQNRRAWKWGETINPTTCNITAQIKKIAC